MSSTTSPTKAFLFLSALILCVQLTIGKSLSIYEQKKYQRVIEGQGLYSADDDVQVLTNANFRELVFRQNSAWLVEFYNAWCGFCQRFAPSWKALATDTKQWQSMIKIGAIDCADDANSPLCREFDIMGYPTLRYFHEFYQNGKGENVQKGTDVEEHKYHLLRHMISEQEASRGVNFPHLLPYKQGTLSNMFDSTNTKAKYAFLLIEKADSLIGPQLELDFQGIDELSVRYASFDNSDLINQVGAKKLPFMVALTKNGKTDKFSETMASREDFRQAIIDYVKPAIHIDVHASGKIFKGKWLEAEVPDIAALMQEKEKQAIRQKLKEMGDAVYQVDLENALRRSLVNEVAIHKEIIGDQLLALRGYVNVLRKYFPFGPNGQIFLMHLFNLVNSRAVVKGEEIATLVRVNELDNKMVFSSKHQWLACEGSQASKRGFPCGLWKLFHYLTVQATDTLHEPKEVLYAMHAYVKEFFGCADCSKHFQEMAKNRDIDSVSTMNAAVLWLWSAHNVVNARLAGDETEDPEYPKVQFPTHASCPKCRLDNGQWNHAEVLRYLKSMYSRHNVKYLGVDVRVLQQVDVPAGRNTRSTSVFEQIDASMCFILYVISFILIMILIRLFLKRGYRKKMYAHDLLGKV